MATVIDIKEASAAGSDELEKKGTLWTRKTKFGLCYYVIALPSETMDDVVSAPGIPPLFHPYGFAYCNSRTPKETNTVTVSGTKYILWEVDVQFDSKVDPSQDNGTDPDNRRPVVTWSGENVAEHTPKGFNDLQQEVPIMTTAGEPIFVEDDLYISILQVTRYERAPFDPNIGLEFANHINISTFYGAPRGCALLMPIEVPEEEIIEGVRYIKPTYQVKFKMKRDKFGLFERDTWAQELLNQGYKHMYLADDGVTLKGPKMNLDDSGNPSTVNLAEDGTILPIGADYVYLKFRTKGYVEFSALNLGPFG